MSKLRELEKLRKELEEMIQIKGVENDEVLDISQKLDFLIVDAMIKNN